MLSVRLILAGALIALASCSSPDSSQPAADSSANKPLVKYSYTGAPMTVFTGVVLPWNSESRMTGYFVAAELPPMTTTDFLDPDIEFPFVNLPKSFAFSDGARTITESDMVDVMKTTADRLDPATHEVRAFSVTTDSEGDVISWDLLFVHDVRHNTYLSAHNAGIYGQDLTEVDTTHYGCVASDKCTANANYTSSGAILPDTQAAGTWTKEVVTSYEGEGM
jgi:hypothetical protein